MKRATLEFNMEYPHERNEFMRAVHGTDVFLVLHDFFEESLRQRIRYDDSLPEEQQELLETLRNELHGYMEHRGVNLDWLD